MVKTDTKLCIGLGQSSICFNEYSSTATQHTSFVECPINISHFPLPIRQHIPFSYTTTASLGSVAHQGLPHTPFQDNDPTLLDKYDDLPSFTLQEPNSRHSPLQQWSFRASKSVLLPSIVVISPKLLSDRRKDGGPDWTHNAFKNPISLANIQHRVNVNGQGHIF